MASIQEWQVTSELEDDGVTHRVSHVTALDKAGRKHELRADLLRVEPGAAGIRASCHGPLRLRRRPDQMPPAARTPDRR